MKNNTFLHIIKQLSLLWIFLLGYGGLIYGQNQVTYEKEPLIDSIEQAYVKSWKTVKYAEGYRIQLVASQTKNGAQKIYNDYISAFPDVPAYLSYMEPTFRVRVGNFTNRIDAHRFLKRIQPQFPGAFITKDKISFKDN